MTVRHFERREQAPALHAARCLYLSVEREVVVLLDVFKANALNQRY